MNVPDLSLIYSGPAECARHAKCGALAKILLGQETYMTFVICAQKCLFVIFVETAILREDV